MWNLAHFLCCQNPNTTSVRNGTICLAQDLRRFVRSCKQLHLLCLPDPWNLPGIALLSVLVHFKAHGQLWNPLSNNCDILPYPSLVKNWFGLAIAWTAALSHRTTVPHSSHHRLCMLEWSLSGHFCVGINHAAQKFKGWLMKIPNKRHFQLYSYCTKSIQVLKLHGFLCRFRLCASNYALNINGKNCCWYWDPLSETGSIWEQSKHKLNPILIEGGP